MEILWWLAPAAVVTIVAMVWVSVLGRQLDHEDRSEAAKARQAQRFAEAITRQHPGSAPRRTTSARGTDRSTGVAIRRDQERRSA